MSLSDSLGGEPSGGGDEEGDMVIAPGCADAVVLESNQQNLLDVIPRCNGLCPPCSCQEANFKLLNLRCHLKIESFYFTVLLILEIHRRHLSILSFSTCFHHISIGILLPCFVLAGSSGCVG